MLLGLSAALSGCGGSSDPAAAAKGKNAKNAANAADSHPDMVAAVSSGKTAGTVELHFAIAERPIAGQAVDIRIVITPREELEQIVARFQGSDAIEVVQGTETGRLERPVRGVDIPHTLTVKPKADGVYSIQAIILSDSETQSVARTFSIPIIVGAGLPEAAPVSPASEP
ncbi:MAG: hypothetical protein ABI885_13300, partial [Gammaproteobacteria bacterium]